MELASSALIAGTAPAAIVVPTDPSVHTASVGPHTAKVGDGEHVWRWVHPDAIAARALFNAQGAMRVGPRQRPWMR